MPNLKTYHWEQEPPRKFTKDILGNKVEVGDFVVFLDRSLGKPNLNLAFVQDITASGNLTIKNMIFKGQFLLYKAGNIKKVTKSILRDELECMRFQIFEGK